MASAIRLVCHRMLTLFGAPFRRLSHGLIVAALVGAGLLATPATAAFVSAGPDTIKTLTQAIGSDGRVLVAGVGARGEEAASALRQSLAGEVALVMGSEALGDLSGLDDFKIFKRARRMPVDFVVVVRVYPQGEGRPATAIAPVYNTRGKTAVTLSFEENSAGGVAAPVTSRPAPLPRPETDGLAAPSMEEPKSEAKAPPPKEERFSILVVDPGETQIDANLRVAVAGKMAAELDTVKRFDVMTAADIRAMTALEANRQLAGCDEESCMSEIADAIGADLVVSWDVSRIGEKRIISVRFFDAQSAKTIGRAQGEATNDGDVAAQAVVALRETIDAFLRGSLDSTEARREEYEANELAAVPTGLFGNGRKYTRGIGRVPIEQVEFYRLAGEDALADDVEGGFALGVFSIAIGGGAVALGFTSVIVGLALGGTFAGVENASVGNVVGAVGIVAGSLTIAAGVVPLLFGAIVWPSPPALAVDQNIAREHNKRLRRKLGLRRQRASNRLLRSAPLAFHPFEVTTDAE